MGMGCWAIGGPLYADKTPLGWGETDDAESLRALETAFDMGVTLFDTADVYGAGHSERLVGKTFSRRRDRVVIATKFGVRFDESTKQVTGQAADPGFIRQQCENSLKRLQSDYIDLYQFHINEYDAADIAPIVETLEALVQEGKIRAYGWSTDNPASIIAMVAAAESKGGHCSAVQFQHNVFDPNRKCVEAAEGNALGAINRGPLAMGILSGKYSAETTVEGADVRGSQAPEWMQYFKDGRPNDDYLARLHALRSILASGERTLAQGSLAWIISDSQQTTPIPGIRTTAQAQENFAPRGLAPFTADELAEIERLCNR